MLLKVCFETATWMLGGWNVVASGLDKHRASGRQMLCTRQVEDDETADGDAAAPPDAAEEIAPLQDIRGDAENQAPAVPAGPTRGASELPPQVSGEVAMELLSRWNDADIAVPEVCARQINSLYFPKHLRRR